MPLTTYTSGEVLTASSLNANLTFAAANPTSSVVQIKSLQTGAVATGTTILPFDDTIPQNTEGDQYMSLAITPTSATNALLITVVNIVTCSSVNSITSALFQDSTANALACANEFTSTATGMICFTYSHKMTAGTTSATTFKVRIGPETANTIFFNSFNTTRKFGGVYASSITITEFIP